jgi:hypothetical protein
MMLMKLSYVHSLVKCPKIYRNLDFDIKNVILPLMVEGMPKIAAIDYLFVVFTGDWIDSKHLQLAAGELVFYPRCCFDVCYTRG